MVPAAAFLGFLKGFLPLSEKTSIFASADVGYTIGFENDYGESISCFYCCPAVGVKLNKFKKEKSGLFKNFFKLNEIIVKNKKGMFPKKWIHANSNSLI